MTQIQRPEGGHPRFAADSELVGILEEYALATCGQLDKQARQIRGFWDFDLHYRPNSDERRFHYRVLSVMLQHQGACYLDPAASQDPFDAQRLIGSDALQEIRSMPMPRKIATIDALLGNAPSGLRGTEFQIAGSPEEKAAKRASLLADAIERLGRSTPLRVLNIGVVGSLIGELHRRGHVVRACDLDPRIVGTSVHQTEVEHGTAAPLLISEADVVVLTGMTVSNGTFTDIVNHARAANARTLIFAETGAFIAEHLCKLGFIDAAFSEPFPFYIFQGISKVAYFEAVHA